MSAGVEGSHDLDGNLVVIGPRDPRQQIEEQDLHVACLS